MCLAGGYYLRQVRTAPQHGDIFFSSLRFYWLPQLVRAVDRLPSPARDPPQAPFFICCCRAYSGPKCAPLYFSPWDNVYTLHTCACMNRRCPGFGGEGKAGCSLPLSRSGGLASSPFLGGCSLTMTLFTRRRCAAEVIPGHMGLGAKPPHSRHDWCSRQPGVQTGSESWGQLSSERPLCSTVACGTFHTLIYSPGCGGA